jgi:hypothetical protein
VKSARPAASPASHPAVENLEDRRLFSTSFVLSIGSGSGFVNVGTGSTNAVLIQSNPLGLPSPALGLPNQSLGLPSRLFTLGNGSFGLNGFGSSTTITPNPGLNLRGAFRGSANLTGVGSTRLNLTITRQRAGTITTTISLPRLGAFFAGTAQVTFLGNRTFTFGFSRGSDQVEVLARLNRNGSITGQLAGQLDTRRLDGIFSAKPINTN